MRKTTRWTMVAAIVVGLASPALLPSASAQADEVVRTNGDVNLRARPGERAPTIVRLDEGTKVRVLGSQGRWLKVSYKGKVGWVTRTQVDDEGETVSARASADKKRKAPAKARKKGFNSFDDEAVGGDAVEDDEDFEAEEADDDPLAEDDEEEAVKPKKKVAKKAKAQPKKKVAKAKPKKKKAPRIEEGSEVVVARTTTVREKASKKADELWDAEEGSEMVVVAVSDDGKWMKVEDSEGEKGWVASKDLMARGGSIDEEDGGEAIDEDMEDEDGERSVRKRVKKGQNAIRVNADLGVLSKQQVYASNGQGLVANYQLANTAPAVILGGSLMRNMGSYWAGVEVGGMMTVGGDGITLTGAMPETLAWSALEINARGVLVYPIDKKKGYAIAGRVGYHTASVTVDVSQTAKLPSEKIGGFTAGAGFDAPKLTDKLGVRLAVDYMVSGTLEQTDGLKDGEQSKTSIFLAGVSGNYQLSAKMDLHLHYQMNFEGFAFGGTNQREATATGAIRKDVQHVVGAGIGYQF